MKLFVQIPCWNEEETLPLVLKSIPRQVPGIDEIRVLIIDDGSSDNTVKVARQNGAAFSKRFLRRGKTDGMGTSTGYTSSMGARSSSTEAGAGCSSTMYSGAEARVSGESTATPSQMIRA